MRSLIAAIIIIVTTGACTKPQDLEFVDIRNIRVVKWGLSESEVALDARFFNPNNQSVLLKDAAAKIYVNSTFLGNTSMDTTVPVPRRDTFAVPLVLKVNTATTLTRIMESLSDSTVNIKVEGSVKMGKAGVFRTFPVNYNRVQNVSELTGQMLGM